MRAHISHSLISLPIGVAFFNRREPCGETARASEKEKERARRPSGFDHPHRSG
jgi:hypothetical protein